MIKIGQVSFNWQFLLVTLLVILASVNSRSFWPIVGWIGFLSLGLAISICRRNRKQEGE